MSDTDATAELPPGLAKILRQFRMLGREEKMAALLAWSKKLEPLPERLAALDREAFTVPECQTRVDLFPEQNPDGTVHFHADVNARQSPTIAAVLAIVFSGVNAQPPATTLALPADIVRMLMQDIGLGARESGLNAMIARLKRHAAAMQRTQSMQAAAPPSPSQSPSTPSSESPLTDTTPNQTSSAPSTGGDTPGAAQPDVPHVHAPDPPKPEPQGDGAERDIPPAPDTADADRA